MLDAIKHITDENFFFQEDSAQVHCVCNTIQLSEICDFHVSAFYQVVNFAPGKIPLRARTPENIYSVPAQETAKHRAKFGWLPLSDVAAVTKPRCETR